MATILAALNWLLRALLTVPVLLFLLSLCVLMAWIEAHYGAWAVIGACVLALVVLGTVVRLTARH